MLVRTEIGLLFLMLFNNKNITENGLSIQVHAHGYYVCAEEFQKFYSFKNTQAIQSIPIDFPSSKYSNFSCILFDNVAHFAPKELVDESKLELYINKNVRVQKQLGIRCDNSNASSICNIHQFNKGAENILTSFYSNIKTKHFASILLDSIIKSQIDKEGEYFFIHIRESYFDVFYTKGNNIQLYNTFAIENEEAFMYFFLSIIKSNELQDFKIFFLGDFPKYKNYYLSVAKYYKNIGFIAAPNKQYDINNYPPAPFFNHIFE